MLWFKLKKTYIVKMEQNLGIVFNYTSVSEETGTLSSIEWVQIVTPILPYPYCN